MYIYTINYDDQKDFIFKGETSSLNRVSIIKYFVIRYVFSNC